MPEEKNCWRVGSKVPLNVYEGDRPVCQCHDERDAMRIVLSVNRMYYGGADSELERLAREVVRNRATRGMTTALDALRHVSEQGRKEMKERKFAMKSEYMITARPDVLTEQWLDERGNDGWSMIQAIEGFIIFQRCKTTPVEEDAEPSRLPAPAAARETARMWRVRLEYPGPATVVFSVSGSKERAASLMAELPPGTNPVLQISIDGGSTWVDADTGRAFTK